jgi:exonuclease III
MCFYINKRLDLNSWRHVFYSSDAGTLYIKIAPGDDFGEVAIYNIYNPSQGYGEDAAGTLPTLENMVITGAEQVVLGDFNLHHPRWNCSNRITRYLAADRLNTITDEAGLTQYVPSEIITYRHPNAVSKIDLCFLSPGLFSRLLSCEAQKELVHGSDYTPILTTIDYNSQAARIHQRRN